MQKIVIIGNLTRDPESRTIPSGNTVCSFTVAVNRNRGREGEADYFRVSAWNKTGENCQKFLSKGRKVCVFGTVSVSAYNGQDGTAKGNLELLAEGVEFLSSRSESEAAPAQAVDEATGYIDVSDDDLPF